MRSFFDRRTIPLLVIIVGLSAALIAVCIDAYAGDDDEVERPSVPDGEAPLACDRASVTTASGTLVKRSAFCPGDLIFEDNFDRLDLERWQHEVTLGGGGNWEFQYYLNSRRNSFVKDGIFFIRPTLLADETGEEFLSSGNLNIHGGTPYDYCTNPAFYGCERQGSPTNYLNPIKSARVRTVNSFNFRYGKVEIRAKIPTGDWLWPALWLMPKINQYGTWPSSGEIDLMESRGNLDYSVNGNQLGVEHVGTTLHFGPQWDLNGYEMATAVKNSPKGQGFNKGFHRYQLEWTPEFMRFSVDDEQVMQVEGNFWELGRFDERRPGVQNPWVSGGKMAPFDQEFYIIMNLAVGGTNGFFPDVPPAVNANGNKPWSNNSPTALRDFWLGRSDWLPTWKLQENDSAEASFQVDYVRVWAL
ncbi:beta-1,3-glucan-binding protein-like [Anopheles merus]|uniref:beta-1,3-glucan-binding protein-like n=1 Tax=Anopheles merus TaxID=30066 RepID=UPI001BE4D61F|nr:beta-1,3-glucan-binding protein-like [Anopheles merus]